MNNELIKRIDDHRATYSDCGFGGTATDKLLADCKAEIERLNKYVPMTASEVDSLWLEAEVCRGSGLEVVK